MAVTYEFKGKTAVLTGASMGIGRRISERLRMRVPMSGIGCRAQPGRGNR